MRTSHRLPPPILNRLSRITVWKEKTETSCHGWFPPKKEACQISPGILHCASLRPVLQVHLCIEEPKKENTPTAPLCKGHRRPYSSHLSKRASASERERERSSTTPLPEAPRNSGQPVSAPYHAHANRNNSSSIFIVYRLSSPAEPRTKTTAEGHQSYH